MRQQEQALGLSSALQTAPEEGESVDDGWEDWDMEDWVAGTGVNLVEAEAEAGAGAEAGVKAAADESWWEVVDSSTMEGAGRAVELDMALRAFAATVEVDGALGDGQLAIQLGPWGTWVVRGVGGLDWSG